MPSNIQKVTLVTFFLMVIAIMGFFVLATDVQGNGSLMTVQIQKGMRDYSM